MPEAYNRQPVDVVVVNYNAGSLLVDCVHSALAQADQVIVVDNGSSDNSLHALEANYPREPRLKIIRNKDNLGFAAGCNLGIGATTEPYVLFLNPDCVLTDKALYRMVSCVGDNPKTGMVGGFLTNPDGSEQRGGRRAIPTPWKAFVRAFGLHYFAKIWPNLFVDFNLNQTPVPKTPVEVEAISGACMLIKREALEDVGNWDEGYFLHCEDLDWCMRFHQKGWKILFVPDAPVIHRQGACGRSVPIFVEWHKHKGMLRFFRKFFSHQWPLILPVFIGIWLRFLASVLYQLVKKAIRGS